jgi:hypothetical protein
MKLVIRKDETDPTSYWPRRNKQFRQTSERDDRSGSNCDLSAQMGHVRFSNRPFGVKRFQTIHYHGVDVARGLVLLFGIGTKALPVWVSKTRRNNLWGGLAVVRMRYLSGIRLEASTDRASRMVISVEWRDTLCRTLGKQKRLSCSFFWSSDLSHIVPTTNK